ncbi:MAG TPA: hypothetical protein VJ183_15995 [Chloroflexia bacterium]|nr:hypothetical protein [Chloroflexia bacterium]
MRNEELLEQCLLALRTGQELSPEAARYLARHPEKRAEIEDLLSVAQRASQLPSAELSARSRRRMQASLAERLGFDPSVLDAPASPEQIDDEAGDYVKAKKPLLSIGRLSVARLRYSPPDQRAGPFADASIREVFRDLTPDDIRRYIGVRGEDYLHYRRALPGWRPVFMFMAIILRGFKRLERFVTVESR